MLGLASPPSPPELNVVSETWANWSANIGIGNAHICKTIPLDKTATLKSEGAGGPFVFRVFESGRLFYPARTFTFGGSGRLFSNKIYSILDPKTPRKSLIIKIRDLGQISFSF